MSVTITAHSVLFSPSHPTCIPCRHSDSLNTAVVEGVVAFVSEHIGSL